MVTHIYIRYRGIYVMVDVAGIGMIVSLALAIAFTLYKPMDMTIECHTSDNETPTLINAELDTIHAMLEDNESMVIDTATINECGMTKDEFLEQLQLVRTGTDLDFEYEYDESTDSVLINRKGV